MFSKKFTAIFDKCFKFTQHNSDKHTKHKLQPWLTLSLIKSCRKKSRLLKIYKKIGTPLARKRYIVYKNALKQILRNEEKSYYDKCFASASNDIRKTWKLINQLLNKNNNSCNKNPIFNIDNTLSQDKSAIVQAFNNYFTNIGNSLASKIPPSMDANKNSNKTVPSTKSSLALIPTNPYEINSIIKSIKNSSACGVDNIPITVIKHVSDSISPVLSSLINLSFESGSFPDALKIAKVIPIFKCGDKTLLTNYRPISLLNSFSKIFAKAFLSRLTNYLTKGNFIVDNQFGFQKNRSTLQALTSFLDIVTDALDNKNYIIALFLDLSKAFDTIDHNILLKKINTYGIRGLALDYIKSYISNRQQFVEIDGVASDLSRVNCGVPQGSSLGPVLFLLYINDLPNCTNLLNILLFADDATLICSSRDLPSLIITLNNELTKIANWFNANKLSLNASKSSYMIINNHKDASVHPEILIGTTNLPQSHSAKFLGIDVDDKLTWSTHIKNIEKKISSAIFIIRNIRYKINQTTALRLYDTLILPHLTYCNSIWGNTSKTHLLNLNRMQKRALRLCSNNKSLSKTDILTFHNKLSISNLNKLQSLLIVYKSIYLPSTLPTAISSLFKSSAQVHQINTRSGEGNCLFQEFARLNIRKYSLRIQGPILWNRLPLSLRVLNSIAQFKINLKSHLQSCPES